MIKDVRIKAIKELIKEFRTTNKNVHSLLDLKSLLDMDYIPHEMDVYEVNNSNYYKSMINGWTSHVEDSKHYSFYVEMIKDINNKVASEWIRVEHDKKDLLIKLHEILK